MTFDDIVEALNEESPDSFWLLYSVAALSGQSLSLIPFKNNGFELFIAVSLAYPEAALSAIRQYDGDDNDLAQLCKLIIESPSNVLQEYIHSQGFVVTSADESVDQNATDDRVLEHDENSGALATYTSCKFNT